MLKNVLSESASPYLRQHADNPVHWQIWGEKSLRLARDSGKPILLSVGYAACHWCHVMAHESFEDPETAALMNELYVNIKVDREERSDIDQIYMAALQAMGEQGGWPLTMFLNSDAEPFWGGTYFPRQAQYGRTDFKTVLRTIADLYRNDPDRITSNADAIRNHLQRFLAGRTEPKIPDDTVLETQSQGILSIYDRDNGGIGRAPKFPNASMLESLWRAWRNTGSTDARDAALHWLRAMMRGGIYDHIGGGMARYSVDAGWLVPHFEKMLYDNAQLIRNLGWAYAQTEEGLFRTRIEETVTWLLREMLLPDGGFASSLDADSEGEEGRFYVWTAEEIDAVTGEDAALFRSVYNISDSGNWEGNNIPNLTSFEGSLDNAEKSRLDSAISRLLQARNRRIRPALDDKALADWNGLLIRALAETGRILDRRDYLVLARSAFDFVSESMSTDGHLAHAWRQGAATYPALANDYASMINAAISLWLWESDDVLLERATAWSAILITDYEDEDGGFYYTSARGADLILRARHEFDDAMPSATGQVIEALHRLSLATGNAALSSTASRAAAAAWGRVKNTPMAASGIVNAIDTITLSKKLVLKNPAKDMLDAIRSVPDPARMDIVVPSGRPAGHFLPADVSGQETGAYFCWGNVCLPPIRTASELEAVLTSVETA